MVRLGWEGRGLMFVRELEAQRAADECGPVTAITVGDGIDMDERESANVMGWLAVVHNPGNFTEYNRMPRCLDRNAWVWRTDNVDPEPRDVRCSDGRIRRFQDGTQVFTHPSTCKHLLPWLFPPN